MSLRLLRVCELIKRELGVIIGREIKFEAPLVSVRAVDITPDLKNAHVFISAIGTKWQKEEAIRYLNEKRQHLQHELSRRVVLKYTPLLHFQLDESIERGTRVLNLLDEIEPTLPPDEESLDEADRK
jgi:ribosome-binding factor A